MNAQIMEAIAQEIKDEFPTLPERVIESAQAIISRKGIVLAKVDEEGNPITPTKKAYAVIHPIQGKHGNWKIVRPEEKKCSCESRTPCAHRLAVYIWQETIKRETIAQ